MKKRLLILLCLAFALRIFLILAFKTYEHPTAWEYEDIANNVLSGKGFIYDDFLGTPYRSLTTPLYVFLCAGVYAVTNHSYFAVLLIQSIFSICLSVMIFKIARTVFGEKVAFISASLTAFHPGYVYYDVFNLIPLSIDSFLIAAAVMFMIKSRDNPTANNMLCMGLVVGIGALARGIIGALLPFISIYLILFTKSLLKNKIRYIAIIWIAALIVIAPWIARNYLIHKEFVFISSTSGENLYRGNNPGALGTSLTSDGKSVSGLWPKEVTDKFALLGEIGQKKLFEKEAMRFIINDPAAFAKLYLKKIYYFWWFSPQSGSIYPKSYLTVYRMVYAPLLIFAFLGAVLALKSWDRPKTECCWAIIFVFMAICLTQSLFYVEGRHRWLIEPLLLIFFSYGITETFKFIYKKSLPGFSR